MAATEETVAGCTPTTKRKRKKWRGCGKIGAVRSRRRISSRDRRRERNQTDRGRERGEAGKPMAQVSRGEQAEEVNGSSIKRGDEEDAAEGSAGFKLNVHAPEFVPRSQLQAVPPLSGCFYPYLPFFENGCGGSALGPGWFYFAEQEPIHFIPDFHGKVAGHSKDSNDVIQKIVKQVSLMQFVLRFPLPSIVAIILRALHVM